MSLLPLPAGLAVLSDTTPSALPTFEISAVLDCVGVAVAIWTLWSCLDLPAGGQLRSAFWLISLGSMAFALSHALDTALQFAGVDAATLIHQGAILGSILLFLPGLASLTDTFSSRLRAKAGRTQPRGLLPLAVGLVLLIGASSFILYGAGALAETIAFLALDGSLLLLTGISLALFVRTRLGGAIGRSLRLALLGLLLFSLAHPVQAWAYENTTYAPDLLGVAHRLIVMPAFFLFAWSITALARSLSSSRPA